MPIAVLSGTDSYPKGWREQPVDTPVWWDEPTATTRSQRTASTGSQAPRETKYAFRPQGRGGVAPGTVQEADEPTLEWVKLGCWRSRRCLSSRRGWEAGGCRATRCLPSSSACWTARGGKLTSVALARALEFPALRLPGLLAKAQRMLNIDGYAVLSRDDASDTVELNRELLLKQFDLVE